MCTLTYALRSVLAFAHSILNESACLSQNNCGFDSTFKSPCCFVFPKWHHSCQISTGKKINLRRRNNQFICHPIFSTEMPDIFVSLEQTCIIFVICHSTHENWTMFNILQCEHIYEWKTAQNWVISHQKHRNSKFNLKSIHLNNLSTKLTLILTLNQKLFLTLHTAPVRLSRKSRHGCRPSTIVVQTVFRI